MRASGTPPGMSVYFGYKAAMTLISRSAIQMALVGKREKWQRSPRAMRMSLPELSVRPSSQGFQSDKLLMLLAAVVVAAWVREVIQQRVQTRAFHSALWTTADVSDGDVFDYVVVGAGAAGCATAGRLARAGKRVLLVEAGEEPGFASRVPGLATTLTGTSMDWSYQTIPNNKSCLGLAGGYCRFVRGKALGGSTSLNLMMYTRGNRKDYDFNVTGWSWEHMEPYFLRAERLSKPHNFPISSIPYHNFSGILNIGNFGKSGNPWHSRVIKGFQYLKFPLNPDVNAESQIGVSRIPGYVHKGERITAARAYLKDTSLRKNLKVVKLAQCLKIIIDKNNVARGITILRNGKEKLNVYAKNEIVLSAGAIGTPHILMLSGIGPRQHLEQFNIPVKSDLPVGEGMLDHVLALTMVKVDQDTRSVGNILKLAQKGFEAAQWLFTKSGPLATVGLGDITTFINTKCYDLEKKKLLNNHTECDIPNMQTIFSYMDKGILDSFEKFYVRITPHKADIKKQVMKANRENALMVASPVMLQPKSIGQVRLASSDPMTPPAIFPNYLDNSEDVEELVKSIKIIRDLTETPIYKKYNASLLKLEFPGCPAYDEEGYWECYVRHMSLSIHHAVGTTSLGTVLDDKLRVRGIKNLRVGDASVLPLLPRGNTAAAIIAIGERLSDFLLQNL